MLDLILSGGTVVLDREILQTDIGIAGETIRLIGRADNSWAARKTLDVGGLWVLPGVVDPHLHFRAPAFPEKEDFWSGTMSAAAGGVTTIIDMPTSLPPVYNGEILKQRIATVQPEALVDFGLYGACGTLKHEDIFGLAEAGAAAFKIFLEEIPPGREEEFKGLMITDDADLFKALEMVRDSGLLCVVHAEDANLLKVLRGRMSESGRKDPLAYVEARPDDAEALSIAKLSVLANMLRVHIHVAHLSSKKGLDLIREARRRGVPITTETCLPFLLFTQAALKEFGPYAKGDPPLRTEVDSEALWLGLRDGTIDQVVSDHSPYTEADKDAGWQDIWQGRPGFPILQVNLPMFITHGRQRDFSLPEIVKLMCENPARLFGLFPRKGTIRPGSDADLVLYDPNIDSKIEVEKLYSKSRGSLRLFQGMPLKGKVIGTMVRGELVFWEDDIVGSPGYGHFVSPIRQLD